MKARETDWRPGPGHALACWNRTGHPGGLWGPAPEARTLWVVGNDPERGWWRARVSPKVAWLEAPEAAWGRWQVAIGARRPWSAQAGTLEQFTDRWLVRESRELHVLCRRLFDLTLAHARGRHQFGRAIGTFWAIQTHLLTWESALMIWGAHLDGGPPGELAWRHSRQEALQALKVCAAIAAGAAHDRGPPFGPPLEEVRRRLTRWPLPAPAWPE